MNLRIEKCRICVIIISTELPGVDCTWDQAEHYAWLFCFSKEKDYYRDSAIVKHHVIKYGDRMPLWVILELMTCSSMSKYYHSMYISDKQRIADKVGVSAATLDNHLHSLSVFRNKCSHGVRLYNSVFNPPVKYNKSFLKANPEIKNDTLFAYILMLIKRLPTDEDRNELKKQISVIVKKYSDVIDLGLAGVPKNYKELLSVHNPQKGATP